MDKIIEFSNINYLPFAIVSGFLILALIGYIVDHKTNRDIKVRVKKVKNKAGKDDNQVKNQPESL